MTKPADTNSKLMKTLAVPAWTTLHQSSYSSVGAAEQTAAPQTTAKPEGKPLLKSVELDRFLAAVERRAFRIALFGVRNPDDALDVVQDAMMQLVRTYSAKPATEWTPLFYRILNNRIRDFQRHNTVRAKVLGFLPGSRGARDEARDSDVSQDAPDNASPGPQCQLVLDGSMEALETAVSALPIRQREAFLLRTLEGLSVRHTASAMQCSEGSVKTHYFRAVKALRTALGEHWPAEGAGKR